MRSYPVSDSVRLAFEVNSSENRGRNNGVNFEEREHQMHRTIIIIALATLCASGCSTVHHVHVNGYSELAQPVASNAAMYVSTDSSAPNPIFQRQVKTSVETLLRGRGYRIAATPEAAQYRVDFQVGLTAESVTGYAPTYSAHVGARGGYGRGARYGYTSYVPYVDTRYDQWLILRLLQAGPSNSQAEAVVWVGEAMMSADNVELRETIDYLLIGCVEYFGVDTGQKVTLTVKKDDPRLLDLAHD